MIFAAGKPSRDQLELLFLIDTYLERADPSWGSLLHRAAATALTGVQGGTADNESARLAA